ncbi:MAG: XrtA/PEP-CTERM system TPR-repeat protein PrsT [Thalassotalea sp.]
MSRRKQYLKIAATATLALSLFACSENKTVDEYLAEAKQFQEQKDYNSAIISMKRANAENPQNAVLRFELGRLYLNQGDYLNAEKEIERAQQLGFSEEKLLHSLVETKFKLSKYDEVYTIAEAGQALSDESYIQVLTYAGLSSLYDGKREQAKNYIDSANQISSESAYGLIGKAYLSQTAEEAEAALRNIDILVKSAPEMADAYLLKAYLLQGSNQNLAAAETFETYSKLRPKEYQIQFFIAQNYLAANEPDKAEPVVNMLLKLSENHPLTNQMKAQIEFDRKNYQAAKSFGVKAYQQSDNFPSAIIIAGMSSYYLGDYEQAYKQLIKVKNKVSSEHLVNKILVELQLRLGYDNEAVESINQLVESGGADTSLLTAASHELLKSGNKAAAQELLQQSINLNSEDSNEIVNQGIMKLKLDDLGGGIEMLEKALILDPSSEKAEAGLAVGYLSNQQFNQALAIAKEWQSTEDKKIQGLLLEAEIANKQQALGKATQLLNEVLLIDSNNIPALYKLAFYAHTAKDVDTAFEYYQKVLIAKPDHIRAIINLTRLISSSRELKEQAINVYQIILNKDKNNNYAKLGLAYVYQAVDEHQKSIELYLNILESENPIDGVEVALGDTYAYLKEIDTAVLTYKKVLDKKPNNIAVGQRLLRIYEAGQQYDKALSVVEQLYNHQKNNDSLLLYKVYFQSKVKKIISKIDIQKLKQSKQVSQHWLLNKALGNIHVTNKSFDLAIPEYQAAYNKRSSSMNVIDLAKALVFAGEQSQSTTVLEKHLSTNPKHSAVKIMLANAYLNENKTVKAIDLYEQLLKERPNNVIVLNNLAYLKLKQNNNVEALLFAEKAAALVPESPAVLDTYGQVLAANRMFTESLTAFDKALLGAKGNVEISINKAKTLILNDQSKEAKRLLNGLKSDTLEERNEIKKILVTLH